MNARKRQASRAAVELIEQFEGYRRVAAQLEDGHWTVGYGHTKTTREGVEVSEADAEALLTYDLIEISRVVDELVYTPLTQNQFDALAAFVFNIGADNFRRSGVLRRLNEGALLQAACAMEMWRRADIEGERILIDALVRRRAAERALFLTPTDGFIPAPSGVVRPRIDHDTTGQVPAERPVEVNAPLDGERAVAERIAPIPPAEPEEPPSASQVAAAAITARLQSILDETESHPGPADAAEAAPTSGPEPVSDAGPETAPQPSESDPFALTAPPAEAPEAPTPEPTAIPAEASPDQAPLFAAEASEFDDFESRRIAQHDFETLSELDERPTEPLRAFGVVPALLGLAGLGLVLFVAGFVWVFNGKHSSGGSLFSSPMGWTLGLVGIGCVATAVYFLLERLGGGGEEQ